MYFVSRRYPKPKKRTKKELISGVKKRAPKIIQKLNLEWLYRLIKEPKRCKRFYQNNVKFIFKVKKLKKETRFK